MRNPKRSGPVYILLEGGGARASPWIGVFFIIMVRLVRLKLWYSNCLVHMRFGVLDLLCGSTSQLQDPSERELPRLGSRFSLVHVHLHCRMRASPRMPWRLFHLVRVGEGGERERGSIQVQSNNNVLHCPLLTTK